MDDELRDLAQQVLDVLAAQRRFFDNGRKREDLAASIKMETQLRKRCERITSSTSSLFDSASADQPAR